MKTETPFNTPNRRRRENKGKSLFLLPSTYCIVDIETTGLSPEWDEIIEISSIKCLEGKCIDSYSKLIKPPVEISEFIEELTGITNEMVKDAEPVQNILPSFLDFIGDSILIAHNAHFDINFLYDNCEYHLKHAFCNDFVDTLRVFRRLYPDLPHHRLQDLAEYYKVEYLNAHRSLNDCQILKKCYDGMINDIKHQYGNIELFLCQNAKFYYYNQAKSANIKTSKTVFDTSHPLYKKVIVFTGVLQKMVRKEAMQIVADLGGINGDAVTKKTNYLVLGNNDYCQTIKDGKSTKQKKAEKLKLAGNDIEIISENVFYDLITDSLNDH